MASHGETILLVEDEESLAEMEEEFLQGLGYRILLAHTGKQALTIAELMGGSIDLLLSDLVMPELTGIQLARQLRARQPRMAVILVSGYAETGGPTAGDRTMAYLQKPFTLSALANKVREVLENRRKEQDRGEGVA